MLADESDRNELQRLYREGSAAIEARNFLLAIELLAKCLALDPDNAYVLNNIGAALDGTQQFDKAIPFYRRAIAVNQDFSASHFNLGRACLRVGDFVQAEASFARARELGPESSGLLKEMGGMFRAKRDFSSAAEAYLKAMSSSPGSPDALECAVTMATMYYLNGDHTGAQDMLRRANPINDLTDRRYLGAKRYVAYLSQLLALNQAPHTRTLPTIHVIGDSHTVSAHGVDIEIKGVNYTCESAWIEGSNQWSTGSESSNQPKRTLDICLRAIPKHHPLLLLFGQLDCLAEGGIFRQWQKNPAGDIDQAVGAIIRKYILAISKYRDEGWGGIIVGGVPAPGTQYPIPEGAHGEVYLGMMRSFNIQLKQATHDSGLPFLDLYAMTATPAGTSNGLWNVDYIHLRPDAFPEAFRKHLIIYKTAKQADK